MPLSHTTRVLIVAHQMADRQELLQAVARRADEGRRTFTLLAPLQPRGLHRVVDPEDHGDREAEARLARALRALSAAAGSDAIGVVGCSDPLAPAIPLAPPGSSPKVRALGVSVAEVIAVDQPVDKTAA